MRHRGSAWGGRVVGLLAAVATGWGAGASSAAAQDGSTPAAATTSGTTTITRFSKAQTRGKGPIPMILIAGNGCDWTVYESFTTRNAGAYSMHVLTMPGFAGTDAPPLEEGVPGSKTVWIDNAVAALGAYIDEQKLDRPYVVGHALGGLVAMRYAIEHGERLAGVVTLDAVPAIPMGTPSHEPQEVSRRKVVDERLAPDLMGRSQEKWAEMWQRNLPSLVTNPERATALAAMVGGSPVKVGARYMVEMYAHDLRDELASVKCRMLAISCVPDEKGKVMSPKEHVRRTSEMFLRSDKVQLVYFQDTRHFVMDDAPVELDRAIDAFVVGRAVRGRGTLKPLTKDELDALASQRQAMPVGEIRVGEPPPGPLPGPTPAPESKGETAPAPKAP